MIVGPKNFLQNLKNAGISSANALSHRAVSERDFKFHEQIRLQTTQDKAIHFDIVVTALGLQ